jgi:hypothetical protein
MQLAKHSFGVDLERLAEHGERVPPPRGAGRALRRKVSHPPGDVGYPPPCSVSATDSGWSAEADLGEYDARFMAQRKPSSLTSTVVPAKSVVGMSASSLVTLSLLRTATG